jgi:hypothetical protein
MGHVACIGDGRGACRKCVGKPKRNGHVKDINVNGRIILK